MSSAELVPASKRQQRLLLAMSVVVGLGGLLFGYDSGVISGALPFITTDFHLDAGASGLVVSSILIGAMIGSLSSGRLADRFGRRTIILAAAVIFIVGAILAGSAANVAMLVLARVILGLGIGMASTLVPLFIAEVAPPSSRGRLVAINQLLITLGIVLAYVIGFIFTNSHNWRAMFLFGVVPALALGIGMLFMPESPRWWRANSWRWLGSPKRRRRRAHDSRVG